jgi:hypothetical protein
MVRPKSAKEVFFRASQLSRLMTESNKKSPNQQLEEAVAQLPLLESKYNLTVKKETATAKKAYDKIQNLKVQIISLKTEIQQTSIPFLGETTKSYLLEVWNSEWYGRNKSVKSKYFKKGNMLEDVSLDQIVAMKGWLCIKNDKRYFNEYIQGEFDTFIGVDPFRAERIVDVKNPYGLDSFSKNRIGDVDKSYWWQGQGYMDLLGCDKYTLIYTLNDTPLDIYEREKTSLWYELGCPDREGRYFEEAEKELQKNHFFHDIPLEERFIEINFERDDAAIRYMHEKVEESREYMQKVFFDNPKFGLVQNIGSIFKAA